MNRPLRINPPSLTGDQRVLIIRPSAIGDIVMASALLSSLRRTWPRLTIAWLLEPPAQVLLEADPDLDAVVLWHKSEWKTLARTGRWLTLLRAVGRLAAALRARRFDVAIDAQGLFRSRALARLSGARLRVGFASREPGTWLMTHVVDRGPRTRVMGSEYRHLAQLLGASPEPFHPRLVLSPAVTRRARARLAAAGTAAAFAVLCPFTTRPQKHWFEQRWAELAMRLYHLHGLTSVLLGGGADGHAAGRIAQACPPGSLINLTGTTSLAESAAIVSLASLVVGVDTGLTHMATAFKRPCVALFGATCPYLTTASDLTTVLYHPLPCSPCRRRPTCEQRFDCMRTLTTSEVLQAAHRQLARLKDDDATRTAP